jgi:hypothetical protein
MVTSGRPWAYSNSYVVGILGELTRQKTCIRVCSQSDQVQNKIGLVQDGFSKRILRADIPRIPSLFRYLHLVSSTYVLHKRPTIFYSLQAQESWLIVEHHLGC